MCQRCIWAILNPSSHCLFYKIGEIMMNKLNIFLIVTFLSLPSSLQANAVEHKHGDRSHKHPLPEIGIAHRHNNGEIGRAITVTKKFVEKPRRTLKKNKSKKKVSYLNVFIQSGCVMDKAAGYEIRGTYKSYPSVYGDIKTRNVAFDCSSEDASTYNLNDIVQQSFLQHYKINNEGPYKKLSGCGKAKNLSIFVPVQCHEVVDVDQNSNELLQRINENQEN